MTHKAFELQPGESVIDTWPLHYSPPGGGKYEGRCTITNQRILHASVLDPGAQQNLAEFLDQFTDKRTCVVIPKNRIRQVETEKSYLEKKVILTLDNGGKHVFSYGALNIDRLVQAISTTDNSLSHQ